jgi:hypothetical protein
LASGAVGVKVQLPLLATTIEELRTVEPVLSVTMSPATPVPEIVGVAVVVSVLPLTGAVKAGAGGAVVCDFVRRRPVPPSETRLKVPLPSVDVWKSRLAVCEPLAICNKPVLEL